MSVATPRRSLRSGADRFRRQLPARAVLTLESPNAPANGCRKLRRLRRRAVTVSAGCDSAGFGVSSATPIKNFPQILTHGSIPAYSSASCNSCNLYADARSNREQRSPPCISAARCRGGRRKAECRVGRIEWRGLSVEWRVWRILNADCGARISEWRTQG